MLSFATIGPAIWPESRLLFHYPGNLIINFQINGKKINFVQF